MRQISDEKFESLQAAITEIKDATPVNINAEFDYPPEHEGERSRKLRFSDDHTLLIRLSAKTLRAIQAF